MRHPERLDDYLGHIVKAIDRATAYLQPFENIEVFLKDASAMILDDAVGAIEEVPEQGMDLFGVDLPIQLRIAGEIGEQHRHLAALADRIGRCPPAFRFRGRLCAGGPQRGDGVEQFAAVADRGDAEIFEILGRELPFYGVVAKSLLVLFQAETAQPTREIHVGLLGAMRAFGL
jgi:hypothetical protein